MVKTQIVAKERVLGTKSINLIIDEYNSEYLSTEEATSLGTFLTEEEELKNSTVLIVAQPVEIERFDNFYDSWGNKSVYKTRGNLKKLIRITSMKVKTLNNVMRTTVEINTLLKITQQFLDNQSNRYQCHNSKMPLTPKMKGGRFQEIFSRLTQILGLAFKPASHNSFSVLQSPSSNSSKNATTFPPEKQSASSNPKFSVSVMSDDLSNHAARSPPSQSKKRIDSDELYRLMPIRKARYKRNFQETVTKYSYKCISKIGHNISGPLPQLIKLAESANKHEQVALIATVLDKIISLADKTSKKVAVIHCEPNDRPLWLKSLFQVTNVTMTIDLGEFLKDTSENLVLVKNLTCVRGLEFSDVLLILDSNEHHLRHFIPEAMARCMSKLSVLIVPSLHENYKSDTVAELVEEWEKQRENNLILSILKIGFCNNPSCNNITNHQRAYCVDGGSYGIHTNCELYRNLLKKIEATYIENIQPDYVKKQEEAEVL